MQITLNRRLLLFLTFLFVIYVIYIISLASRPFAIKKQTLNAEIYRDWNDYKFIANEAYRLGPGEHGAAVYLIDAKEIQNNEEAITKTGFSAIVSDKISVNRSLPIVVHPDCQKLKYLAELPKVSVIIIYYNEVLSILLRTIHSIYNRTPKELLYEIILVNDHSTEDQEYATLPDYLAKNFPEKSLIKMLKLPVRSGLIVARMEGARAAQGEILVFFDSHVEVQNNWLPPLLQPIVRNRKIATLPIVDYFDCQTFEYYPEQVQNQGTRGIVDWFLNFHELEKLEEDRQHPIHPFPNPIMLGCAFAIDRKFFIEELGGYDEELRIWNGENYELSFKLWMCRGGLFTVPCSRVGHSFRDINPSRKLPDDYVARNFKRIAEVWLDEFKELLYEREPERYRNLDPGDLSRPKLLREKLNCKSFRWFLKYIAPDMIMKYPPISKNSIFASGAVQSAANPRFCLDNLGRLFNDRIGIYECGNNLMDPGKNQKFQYTFYKDLRLQHNQADYCLDSHNLNMDECNQVDYGNQVWIYDLETKQIINNSKCLTVNLQDLTIHLMECKGHENQKWNFGYVNHTAFQKFNDISGYSGILNA